MMGFVLMTVFCFKISGKQYPLSYPTLLLYAVAAVFAFTHGQLTWLLASSGIRGVWFSSMTGLVVGLINWGACYFWIPNIKIAGAAVAGIVASGAGVLLCEISAGILP